MSESNGHRATPVVHLPAGTAPRVPTREVIKMKIADLQGDEPDDDDDDDPPRPHAATGPPREGIGPPPNQPGPSQNNQTFPPQNQGMGPPQEWTSPPQNRGAGALQHAATAPSAAGNGSSGGADSRAQSMARYSGGSPPQNGSSTLAQWQHMGYAIDEAGLYLDSRRNPAVNFQQASPGAHPGGVGSPGAPHSPPQVAGVAGAPSEGQCGVGLSFSKDASGQYKITGLRNNSPASLCCQLQVGDVLLKVNGESVNSMTTQEIIARVLGPPNSAVTIQIQAQCGYPAVMTAPFQELPFNAKKGKKNFFGRDRKEKLSPSNQLFGGGTLPPGFEHLEDLRSAQPYTTPSLSIRTITLQRQLPATSGTASGAPSAVASPLPSPGYVPSPLAQAGARFPSEAGPSESPAAGPPEAGAGPAGGRALPAGVFRDRGRGGVTVTSLGEA
mmetsp:Transcript_7352/g.17699  ORF Transcript_7352/g.17699 Transcript_7352/m.17699 type:complete len:442 (+) Transcript_7352:344-1669(+)